MIDLSRKNIVKVANESGFIKDNVEKVMRLIDILETVFLINLGRIRKQKSEKGAVSRSPVSAVPTASESVYISGLCRCVYSFEYARDAECLFDNKQYEEAIARYERLLSLPGYAMKGYALSYIAYCHAQLGHDEQALHYRQQAEKERTNNLHELFPDLYSAEDYRNTLLNNLPSPEDSTNELPF